MRCKAHVLSFLKHLNLKGISCHIGSQIHNLDVFEKVFSKMKNAIKILEDYDLKIDFLDLGGGFSVKYNNEKETKVQKRRCGSFIRWLW